MRKWVRTSAKTALLTAGFVALGTGISYADVGEVETSGNGSVLSGNQAVVDANAPINVTGNAVSAVGGLSGASSDDSGTIVHERAEDETETSGNGSVGSGNQVVADADVPVNVAGNAVGAVVGIAGASADDTGSAVVHQRGGDELETSGNGAVGSGNQLNVDADVPLNACGNAVGAVVGIAGASCEDSGSLVYQSDNDEVETSGNGSVLGGNQANVDVDLPVNVAGNAVSAVGGITGASADETGSAVVHQSAGDEFETSGNGSVLSGNQIVADADVPVNVCGNAVSAVIGLSGASCDESGAAVIEGHDHHHGHGDHGDKGYRTHQSAGDELETSGNGSVLGGNQANVDADIPVNVCGNAVSAVIGLSGASCDDSGAAVIEGHKKHHGDHGHDWNKGHEDEGYGYGYENDERTAQSAGDLVGGVTDLSKVAKVDKGQLGAAPVVRQMGGDELETNGNGSVLGGNQANVDADVPVNVCGNAVSAVVGLSGASCDDSGAIVHQSDEDEVETSGNGSVLGGNQADVDADVPVNVAGNAVGAVVGIAGASAEDTGAAVVHQKAGAVSPMSGMPALGGDTLGGLTGGLL